MYKLIIAAVLIIIAAALIWSWVGVASPTIGPVVADPAPAIRCAPPLISIGMTREALDQACGKPTNISHQMLRGTDRVQMSFNKGESYVYLSNGIVDAIQYAENGERWTWGRP